MKIVVDTNVIISGVFFGGPPQLVLSAIVASKITACATAEIVDEYYETMKEMISRRHGTISVTIFSPLIHSLELIVPRTHVKLSRDPEDDKFLGCAKDAKARYIISGDKDLLVLGRFKNIEIITAREFCERHLARDH